MNKYLAESRASQRARRKRRMCDDKVRYPTAEAARQKGQDIYFCKHCRHWHRSGAVAQLAARLMRRFP